MMLGGMTTRSRGRRNPASLSNNNNDGSCEKNNADSVEHMKHDATATFSPLSIDAPHPKTDYINKERPALISPSPDEASLEQRRMANSAKAKKILAGPVLPDVDDLFDQQEDSSSQSKSQSTSELSDSSFFKEPPHKRTRIDHGGESTAILEYQGGNSSSQDDATVARGDVVVDERIHQAAAVLVQMRHASCDEQDEEDSSPPRPARNEGMRLAQPQDSENLNSLHCFVRSELLELFVLPGRDPDDDHPQEETPLQMDKKRKRRSLVLPQDFETEDVAVGGGGRVGLRCVYCAHLPRNLRGERCTMSTFYPKSLMDIYRMVCTWQRVHFQSCRHVPESVARTYKQLKVQDRTRGKTKYWVTSAQEMGLVDVNDQRGGVRFAS